MSIGVGVEGPSDGVDVSIIAVGDVLERELGDIGVPEGVDISLRGVGLQSGTAGDPCEVASVGVKFVGFVASDGSGLCTAVGVGSVIALVQPGQQISQSHSQ